VNVGFLFPGQGSQRAGMLHALPDHPEVAVALREASGVLGLDVLGLDGERALESTVAAQLALYTAGVAAARALNAEGAAPDIVAGLSVGAYAAATVCGALDFRDGVRLVRLRAERMAERFPRGYGLSAIVGLDEQKVSELVAASTTPEHPVFVSNLNAPRQIVVAGSVAGMEKVLALALQVGCRKAERLPVAIPSHCPLLQGVAEELTEAMKGLEPRVPHTPYLTNRRARVTRAFDRIREDIATNIAHQVRWNDSTEVMVEMGVRLFVEVHPGRVLTSLVAAEFPEVRAIALGESSFAQVARLVREVRACDC
jgi:malonate decarboxylase epsilon subunit